MTNELYLQNKKIIYKHAGFFSKKYGVEIEEVLSEANLIYCEAVENYDSGRAAFSTYLWNQLNHCLGTFCKNIISQREKEIASNFLAEQPYRDQFEDNFFFRDTLNKISDDEKEVVNFILKDQSRWLTKEKIKKELRQRGWKYPRIERTFNNVQRAFEI